MAGTPGRGPCPSSALLCLRICAENTAALRGGCLMSMVARVAPGAPGCPTAYGCRNRYPRAKGPSRVLYKLMKYVLLGPLLRLFFPCKVIGSEYIPAEGGAILVGNHLSVADSFFTPLHIKRRVTYLAK